MLDALWTNRKDSSLEALLELDPGETFVQENQYVLLSQLFIRINKSLYNLNSPFHPAFSGFLFTLIARLESSALRTWSCAAQALASVANPFQD